MIRHIWSVLCERSIVDKETNRISHFMCYESILVDKLPGILPLLTISTYWLNDSKDPSNSKFKLTVVYPDGTKETPVQGEIPELAPFAGHRTILTVTGFKIKHVGTYIFQIFQHIGKRYKKVAELPLIVKQTEGKDEEETTG